MSTSLVCQHRLETGPGSTSPKAANSGDPLSPKGRLSVEIPGATSTNNTSMAAVLGPKDFENPDIEPPRKKRKRGTRRSPRSVSLPTPPFDVDLPVASTCQSVSFSTASRRESESSANTDKDLYSETGRLQRKSAVAARRSQSLQRLSHFDSQTNSLVRYRGIGFTFLNHRHRYKCW